MRWGFLYQLNPFRVTVNPSRHLSRAGNPGSLPQTEDFQQICKCLFSAVGSDAAEVEKTNSSSFNVKF